MVWFTCSWLSCTHMGHRQRTRYRNCKHNRKLMRWFAVSPHSNTHTSTHSETHFGQLLALVSLHTSPSFLPEGYTSTPLRVSFSAMFPLVSESAWVPSQSMWELPAVMVSLSLWGCDVCSSKRSRATAHHTGLTAWTGGKGKERRVEGWGEKEGGEDRRGEKEDGGWTGAVMRPDGFWGCARCPISWVALSPTKHCPQSAHQTTHTHTL